MKPIFNRAPLTPNTVAPLPAGSIRAEGWLAEQLRVLAKAMAGIPVPEDDAVRARLLDARIALAWTLDDAELKRQCTDEIAAITAAAHGDGSLTGSDTPLTTDITMLTAIRRCFTATGDKSLLTVMDRYFKYLYRRMETTPLKGDEVVRGADMIELALWLYNLSGQKYLPELCWKLRTQTMEWPDTFHTFRVKNPMSRTIKQDRMAEGLHEEAKEGSLLEGENRPYFATMSVISDGASVAAGLRAPGIFNMIKSGFKEKDGFTFGWTRIRDSHGVANGLYTCDSKLNGRNPNQGTSLTAIAELMQTLETLIGLGDAESIDNLAEALEKVAYNALPAAFNADMTAHQTVQQTNQVCVSKESRPWYSMGEDAAMFTAANADGMDGWPKFASSLWYATDDGGLTAVSYAPCTVRAVAGGVPVRVSVTGSYPFTQSVNIEVSVKQPAEFPLYLRVPAWARQPMIFLPDGEILQVRAGEVACVRRHWRTGDTVRLDLPTAPRLTRWYLQSAAVELGPLVMVCQPEEEWEADGRIHTSAPWNWALLENEPMKVVHEGTRTQPFHGDTSASVGVLVKAVNVNWNHSTDGDGYTTGNAGSVPMGESATGEPSILRLVPYGDTTLRVTQFPTIKE